MNVLMTGGAGFIGSHLTRRLMEQGHTLTIVDDLSSGRESNLPPDSELLVANLGDASGFRVIAGRRFDAICHLAGQSSGEKSFDDPVRDFDANARSTMLLSSWALANGVGTLLHASSMSVYGQPPALPAREDGGVAPLSPYGASKLSAEQVLAVAGRRGLRTLSFRMFSVYGRGQDLSEMRQGMVSIYLAYILRGEPVTVKGPLDRVRDFVHVDDVVDAWVRALEGPVAGVLNLGTGVGTTVRDLLSQLVIASGNASSYPVEEAAGTPGDQHSVFADIARIRDALRWEPRVRLRDGLDDLVAWAKTEVPA